ncbi:MAG: 50S ribosomal protein L24 [Cytophagales bacterium]|nr:50S ribosomal protein L24 [Cytophagales bacterium]
MANKKYHIKTGDNVKVIAGDEKGKTGKVVKVVTSSDRAVVEGLNMVTKHIKPSATNPNGGIEKVEAPIHISNLKVIDTTGEATRTGRKLNDQGKLQRYSKNSGEFIADQK